MTHDLRRSLATTLLIVTTLLCGAAPVAAQPEATIVIGERLRPRDLLIEPGTVVTWRNDDDERHRVRSREGPVEFDSGNLQPGEIYIFTFTVEGIYPYLDERDDEDRAYFGTVEVRARTGPSEPLTDPTVVLFDEAFNPPDIEIATGGTVAWSNEDGEDQHTVTSTDGAFDSGIMDAGTTFTETFVAPGTFPYFCAIHPEMTGTVTVTGPPVASASSGPAASGDPEASLSSEPVMGTAVSIVDLAFAPEELAVPLGATVTWTNDDPFEHTATAADGSFDSGVMAAGATFEWTFETAGTVEYFCAIHPSMTGSVTVGEPDGAVPATVPP